MFSSELYKGVTRLAIDLSLITLKIKLIIIFSSVNIGIKFRDEIIVVGDRNYKI